VYAKIRVCVLNVVKSSKRRRFHHTQHTNRQFCTNTFYQYSKTCL